MYVYHLFIRDNSKNKKNKLQLKNLKIKTKNVIISKKTRSSKLSFA